MEGAPVTDDAVDDVEERTNASRSRESLQGLGAAALLRAALGVRAMWVPIIGALTWLGFGRIGILGGHLDNALNAAFVMCGFAAAVVLAAEGKGMLATAFLFMGAALAEWPFY